MVQLGVTLDSKLNFSEHINLLTTKCSNLVYVLRKIRHLLNCEEAKLIYTSIVRSKLEYCSLLFQLLPISHSRKIESVQNKAIRVICRAPQKFSVTDGRKLLNLHTLCSRRQFCFRNLVSKVMSGIASSEVWDCIQLAVQTNWAILISPETTEIRVQTDSPSCQHWQWKKTFYL